MTRYTRRVVSLGGGLLIAIGIWLGCDGGMPQLVLGPGVTGNEPPTLEITGPSVGLNVNQGERFTITWQDSDPDSSAKIAFFLQDTNTGLETEIISNIEENDSLAPDSFSASTAFVPLGTYYLRGEINDTVNAPVSVFALTAGSTSTRVVINVGEPGSNPLSVPPQVVVIEPSFPRGVAQEDTLDIVVQPTENAAAGLPYDSDSDARLFILFDLDNNPENDDPLRPDASEIILQRDIVIPQGDADARTFTIPIDLNTIPPRVGGLPYYVRATIIDDGNPPVHSYADGTISILLSATGTVDVAQVGRSLSGARFQGFNPGSRLGSTMTTVSDYDADGIDDFVMVAQFGNPRNFGNIGEAYLVYGLPQQRFGGTINANSISSTISGVIIEGTPNRLSPLHENDPLAAPQGITHCSFIPDLSGDGRPEILIGTAMVDGSRQGRDDDPGDDADMRAVEIIVEQGRFERNLNNLPFDSGVYFGSIDNTLDRLQPTTSFETSVTLILGAAVMPTDAIPADQFPVISFNGLRNLFTTTNAANVDGLEASLRLRQATGTLPQSDEFTVHRLLDTLNENDVYASFNADGMPGPTADTDYDAANLDAAVDFNDNTITINVTDTIQALIDGELNAVPGWIMVPADVVNASFVSAEGVLGLRPLLTITYDETLETAINFGCYPDPYSNNQSDTPDDPNDGPTDFTLEASGAVYMLNSENRDTSPFISTSTRLDTTTVVLELIGQEGVVFDSRTQEAGDPTDFNGLTRGSRITAGWWESILPADARTDFFGDHVASIPDVNNDGRPELIVSSPRNERYFQDTASSADPVDLALTASTAYQGSVVVIPGADFSAFAVDTDDRNAGLPYRTVPGAGSCSGGIGRGGPFVPNGGFEIFAENIDDFLGGAEYAGDVNQDGVPDIVCGAPRNDLSGLQQDTGAAYIIYLRRPVGDVDLSDLDNPAVRPPSIRIRGLTAGDQFGHRQLSGEDINGDGIDDVFFSSPTVDFGGVQAGICGDIDGNGVVDGNDLDVSRFDTCRRDFGEEVFLGDACKGFDYDNDRDIDDEDEAVFVCLASGAPGCCPIDNGFVGIVFGDLTLTGDRSIAQIATPSLPGVRFFGGDAGDRAGADIASAGDFNRDGFGDLLIAAPGVRFEDVNGRERLGVAYLVFGGTHLDGNRSFSLDQVGTSALPGIIFQSPFVAGRPNEAPIDNVGLLGDVNADGFDDIGLGVTRADFVDINLPQDPANPGTDPNIGRRPDDGSVYLIYGNNTGSNR